jgi:sec-independent protein translocase protein TatB
MFNVGGGEILVILLLALLVLGPDKLPEYARKAGRYMNEFRRMTSGFQEEFRQAMDLTDTSSSSSTPTGGDDALHRTTEGPRLAPRAEVEDAPPAGAPAASEPEEPAAPAPPSTSPAPSPPTPTYGGAFAADVTPAPGTGPELITPTRPAEQGDESDNSSAA